MPIILEVTEYFFLFTAIESTSQHEITTKNTNSEMTVEDPVTEHRDGHRGKQCSDKDIAHMNIATGRRATQSTQWDRFGDANNAIDRKRQGVYLRGSCSHTKAETNPWWRVDLQQSRNITSVAITNREDCCSERINGAEIHIGNSLENNGNDNPVCAVIPYIPAGQTRTYQCHGMEGRYISIVLPGKEKYLTLCEVEVKSSAPHENVALRGKASQSSQYDGLTQAQNAIDGNHNTHYRSRSCTHTQQQANPWWRVDLLCVYRVTSVTITNRGDCCSERLNGAEIRIGSSMENNGNNNPVCAVVSTIPSGESMTFHCHGMEGRYVNVILPGSLKYLALCEVEVNASHVPENMVMDPVTSDGDKFRESQCSENMVMGPVTTDAEFKESQRSVPAPDNAAYRGKATQSSTGYDGDVEKAIDRNRNPFYEARSCTHTTAETNPWWRVDLLRKHIVTAVTVTNRGDCCSSRLNGAEIRVGNRLENNGNDNPVCAVISHIQGGDSITFQCHETEGRYVNVFLPGKEKHLTLCEVEVYGSVLPNDNAACHGKATQSSTAYNGGAEKAIDRNHNPFYKAKSCTHTAAETNPWWQVDLLRKYSVTSVTVTNRVDCCASSLDGAEIRVGNSLENNGNDNPVCAVISHIQGGDSITFQCHEMEGRYVNVFLPGREKHLTLCEVEVNGSGVPNG
ncbi:hypothetical protein SKAU_G00217250 [Synaphobranchus kaupii]|uniref:Fucolectin tachylectin-4 pentraxin-1 domain-containing protein n=1 Tax=Synaphobranchus kaupii TaxID=118154 RepID=A0A9Q1FA31_SYNKA|nr:hypothetical protein SKAU_G00217250 [Synaphobranchus kaupii]